MAALNINCNSIFRKNQVGCHQRVLKFKLSLAIARRTFNRFGCFIPNFKLKYEDSENTKADRVNTVVFNLQQIRRWTLSQCKVSRLLLFIRVFHCPRATSEGGLPVVQHWVTRLAVVTFIHVNIMQKLHAHY